MVAGSGAKAENVPECEAGLVTALQPGLPAELNWPSVPLSKPSVKGVVTAHGVKDGVAVGVLVATCVSVGVLVGVLVLVLVGVLLGVLLGVLVGVSLGVLVGVLVGVVQKAWR